MTRSAELAALARRCDDIAHEAWLTEVDFSGYSSAEMDRIMRQARRVRRESECAARACRDAINKLGEAKRCNGR